jgi:light-regulated signal transduction histidine kinase (bacteriophytochrome)
MAQLIDDMLQLSRITRTEMRRVPVNLSSIARTIADDLCRCEPERCAEFVIAPDLTAKGDPDLLRIVLQNLIHNSWKFTNRNASARIEIGTREADGERVFFVRDDGAGFDMRYVHKLFTAFQRLHAASEFPGTGIGLASVQRVIRRHGGKVWAEGRIDEGATIYFTV